MKISNWLVSLPLMLHLTAAAARTQPDGTRPDHQGRFGPEEPVRWSKEEAFRTFNHHYHLVIN
jgi:hypothetical protein